MFISLFLISIFSPAQIAAESTQEMIERVITLSEQRDTLQTEVDGFTAQIDFLEDQIEFTQDEIKKNQAEVEKIKKDLDEERKYLAEYLRVLYEDEQMSFIEKLFKARSFSEFVDRREYLNNFKDQAQQSVVSINKSKKMLEREERILTEMTIQNQLSRAAIAKQKADKEKILTKVTKEERKIREKFADRLAKFSNLPYCKEDDQVIKAKYSIFSFPTDCGFITQGFGMTEFASIDRAYSGAIHNGFDIGVNTGTPIKSVGNGEVFAKGASPSGGWGNWVMVKHDKVKVNNSEIIFYSLYAHLVTETHLKVGSRVSSKTIVGLSGGTPYWAPHLHFSLLLSASGWSDGKTGAYPGNAVDPLDYMDIPISTGGTDWDLRYAH